MTRSPEVQAVCDAAADRLEAVGWGQGALVGPNGCVCMGVAIHSVSTDHAAFEDVIRELEQELQHGKYGVVRWNDAPHRTLSQVLDFLRNGTVVA